MSQRDLHILGGPEVVSRRLHLIGSQGPGGAPAPILPAQDNLFARVSSLHNVTTVGGYVSQVTAVEGKQPSISLYQDTVGKRPEHVDGRRIKFTKASQMFLNVGGLDIEEDITSYSFLVAWQGDKLGVYEGLFDMDWTGGDPSFRSRISFVYLGSGNVIPVIFELPQNLNHSNTSDFLPTTAAGNVGGITVFVMDETGDGFFAGSGTFRCYNRTNGVDDEIVYVSSSDSWGYGAQGPPRLLVEPGEPADSDFKVGKGGIAAGEYYLEGYVDEFAIWDRPLTEAEAWAAIAAIDAEWDTYAIP